MAANNAAEVDANDDGVEAVVALDIYVDLIAKGVGELTTAERASRLVDRAAVRNNDVVDVKGSSLLVVESLAISQGHAAIETKLCLPSKTFELVHRVVEQIRNGDVTLGILLSIGDRRLAPSLRSCGG
jgi:hypothetical protein